MLRNTWVRSSHSESGNCVEVLAWIKSSYSGSNQNCVEVAGDGTRVLVRDSKDPGGPALVFTPDEWTAFLDGARNGEFDNFAQAGRQAATRGREGSPSQTGPQARIAIG